MTLNPDPSPNIQMEGRMVWFGVRCYFGVMYLCRVLAVADVMFGVVWCGVVFWMWLVPCVVDVGADMDVGCAVVWFGPVSC